MLERISSLNCPESNSLSLREIDRSYKEEITLTDFGDAFAVDNKFVVAYKNFWVPKFGQGHKILIARERTVPVKYEDSGNFMFPYRDEDKLRGQFGVLIMPMRKESQGLYVGEQYRVIFDKSYFEDGVWNADISIESPNPIKADFIDGSLDYNDYLRSLRQSQNAL